MLSAKEAGHWSLLNVNHDQDWSYIFDLFTASMALLLLLLLGLKTEIYKP